MSGDRIVRGRRFTVTPEHLILDPRVGDRAVRIWMRLDRYAGDKGGAFPSRAALGVELDTSVATIDRAIVELVNAGWLKKSRRVAGGTNLYVLSEPSEKLVRKLVKETRDARWAAEAERRAKSKKTKAEKDAARAAVEEERREAEADAVDTDDQAAIDELEPAFAQVSEGGVLTGEDTPVSVAPSVESARPVLTSEDTPSSPVRTGVLTHDEQKEASLSETQGRSSDPSLRSGSAESPTDTLPIELPQAAPAEEQDLRKIAGDIADTWLKWAVWKHGPYVGTAKNPFMALRPVIERTLATGVTVEQVQTALKTAKMHVPTTAAWQRAVSAATGHEVQDFGRTPKVVNRFQVEENAERHADEAAKAFG